MLYKKDYVGQGFVGMAPKGSRKRDKVRVMAPTWAPVKGAGGRCGQAIWAVARDWPLLLPKGSVAEARGNEVEKAMDLGNMGVKLKNESEERENESEESDSESEESESESSSDEDIDEDAKLLKELDRLHAKKEHTEEHTEEHKEEKTEEQSVPSIPLILMPKHCGKDLATGYKLCK
ncbi:acidic leucine-rich nuclear phosphoprotein 32 family member B [Selaginella moellendorffii]|uniref:acidic leucine-rich nuclear phosphoprotein 32 family member B n=1 Tax=Selaginella moellendorffii TaxID=88036 RepID=UPI000D1C557D|nr:acidic leucine-rich nuclear phosphoprotein 32 family member B [Selaginella moellendorffii]XP_024530751.1 acidic leucine-rich nuclear phosphoprotein 32 family member B [Selaginella moellendorffii]|eukprot:XP_024530750.1 acidic leucine-rich nuclear phosphoprotein 32 family member B [Selaginella moellendorffii]